MADVDFDEEEVVFNSQVVKDEPRDEDNPPEDPLEQILPTDVLPSAPPTDLPSSASAVAASKYPQYVTTAANIPQKPPSVTTSSNTPQKISPLVTAPPLPDEDRGRSSGTQSSGTPQPPAKKVARVDQPTSYTPSHLLRFTNHFDPTYDQARHDVLSTLRFPTTQYEEYNFWVGLYFFVSTPLQPIALPITLSACNISRDSHSNRPYFCTLCQQGFPTMGHFCNHSWANHLSHEEKMMWEQCVNTSVTAHDLLWFYNGASLSLTPLPHNHHSLTTLPKNLRLRDDGTWNPIVALTPYHRNIVKTSATPTYIQYHYLKPADCFEHAKHLRRLHHETPDAAANSAVPQTSSKTSSSKSCPAPIQGAEKPCVSALSTSVPPPLTSPQPAAPLPKHASKSVPTPDSSRPKPPAFSPHGHSYNTYPNQVPINNTDVSAFVFNPFNLPPLISYNPTESSTLCSAPDTCTFHDWRIDSSLLDLNLFRFVAPNPPNTTLLFKALDATKHLYKRYYLALPDSYFLLYQLALHASVFHWCTLNACVCHSLDPLVPPHLHSTSNQCQRVFVLCQVLEKSLNNILHHTYLSLSTSIQDPDIPNATLYLIFSVFSYATKLLTVKTDRSSYLLDSPLLPTGLVPTTLSDPDIQSIRTYFNQLDAQMPDHILKRK